MSKVLNRMSRRSSQASEASSPPTPPQYLYSVKAIKNYDPDTNLEIHLVENEIYLVLEELNLFYLAYSKTTRQTGYVPKNYTKKHDQYTCFGGFSLLDYSSEVFGELKTSKNDKLIIVARDGLEFVYCKKITSDSIDAQAYGKLPVSSVYVEGSLSKLPTLEEYKFRNSPKSPQNRSRRNTGTPAMIDVTDERIMEKLLAQAEAPSGRSRASSNANRFSRASSMYRE